MNSTGAPLLPKLRGYIAEFLTNCSHERLWIFSSSTCVGLRYGSQPFSLEVFLGSVDPAAFSHTAYCFTSHRLMPFRLCLEEPAYTYRTSRLGGPAYPSAAPHRAND